MRESDLLARITRTMWRTSLHPGNAHPRQRRTRTPRRWRDPEQILADYSYLQPDDIAASLLYAAHQLDHPILAA